MKVLFTAVLFILLTNVSVAQKSASDFNVKLKQELDNKELKLKKCVYEHDWGDFYVDVTISTIYPYASLEAVVSTHKEITSNLFQEGESFLEENSYYYIYKDSYGFYHLSAFIKEGEDHYIEYKTRYKNFNEKVSLEDIYTVMEYYGVPRNE